MTARNLTDANPSFRRDISGEKNPMFGKAGLSGEAHPMFGRRADQAPRWKGGRVKHAEGYWLVVAPEEHPYPAYVKPSGTKYILEHRLLMERHLGRYLEPEEVVHHKDDDGFNNDLSNLVLYANQSEHMRLGHGGRPR